MCGVSKWTKNDLELRDGIVWFKVLQLPNIFFAERLSPWSPEFRGVGSVLPTEMRTSFPRRNGHIAGYPALGFHDLRPWKCNSFNVKLFDEF